MYKVYMNVSQNKRKSDKKLSKQGTLSYRQKLFKKNIGKINIKISKLKDNELIKFNDYCLKLLHSALDDNKVRRVNFLNRTEYSLFKDNHLNFFYQKFFLKLNDKRFIVNPNLYTFICDTFDHNIVYMIENLIIKIDECLVNRKYDPVKPDSIYNHEQFSNSLNILGINNTCDVTFTTIKENYEKKKEYSGGNNELKKDINKAYILLRNQYENYLLSRQNYNQQIPNQIDVQHIDNDYIRKFNE